MKKTVYFTVFFDTDNGFDWDESFSSLLPAWRYYHSLRSVPFKKLVMTDSENGDRTVLSSKGVDNVDRYGLRCYVNLAR